MEVFSELSPGVLVSKQVEPSGMLIPKYLTLNCTAFGLNNIGKNLITKY